MIRPKILQHNEGKLLTVFDVLIRFWFEIAHVLYPYIMNEPS